MEVQVPDKQKRLRRLRCSVQNYDWGRLGSESTVARLFSMNSGAEVQLDKPYAELWMGTHESGPSFLIGEGKSRTLKSWISENPNVLGDEVVEKWGSDLPFLFKVLSVAKALSIQAHPDKELARTLHKLQPHVYKDDNHKPEMALAITEFQALCGFVSLEELKIVLKDVPEIVEVVGSADANQVLDVSEEDGKEKVKSVLQSIFTQLMSANKEMVSKIITKLKIRLQMESQMRQLTDKEQLVLRLEKQYPGDVGVISAFFFNYVKLNPDNVVRAGLTPKHRDVQTLCSMLTYKQGFPEILQGVPLNPYTRRYLPPFDEFEVDCCSLPKGASAMFPAVEGPSIFVVTVGEGTAHVGHVKSRCEQQAVLSYGSRHTSASALQYVLLCL
ncbi:Mannose-6-phosphate isomerase 2 [Vitis vinifera]|uniref:mannose-6-phosphate isomerase n=1 Tax=Vitis vinifera TaxID=29760 RepID=A0A438DAC6_VITVI|nr:Mannose-6-phosphate isomerase 2 [Vitis vinifera]